MSDYLVRQIKAYLETIPGETAVAIERRADLPGSTITRIIQGSRPRVDRLAQLLTGVDADTAAEWLRAYLLDDVPPAYTHNVRVAVEPLSGSRLQEKPKSSTTDKFTDAIERLRSASAGDDELAQWFIDSINLILGYKNALEISMDNVDQAIETIEALKHPVEKAMDDLNAQFSQSTGEDVNKKKAREG